MPAWLTEIEQPVPLASLEAPAAAALPEAPTMVLPAPPAGPQPAGARAS